MKLNCIARGSCAFQADTLDGRRSHNIFPSSRRIETYSVFTPLCFITAGLMLRVGEEFSGASLEWVTRSSKSFPPHALYSPIKWACRVKRTMTAYKQRIDCQSRQTEYTEHSKLFDVFFLLRYFRVNALIVMTLLTSTSFSAFAVYARSHAHTDFHRLRRWRAVVDPITATKTFSDADGLRRRVRIGTARKNATTSSIAPLPTRRFLRVASQNGVNPGNRFSRGSPVLITYPTIQ